MSSIRRCPEAANQTRIHTSTHTIDPNHRVEPATIAGKSKRARMFSQTATFAQVLRRQREARGLTQESLAERARLSARAISDLERGLKQTPHATTVHLLIQAL